MEKIFWGIDPIEQSLIDGLVYFLIFEAQRSSPLLWIFMIAQMCPFDVLSHLSNLLLPLFFCQINHFIPPVRVRLFLEGFLNSLINGELEYIRVTFFLSNTNNFMIIIALFKPNLFFMAAILMYCLKVSLEVRVGDF